MNIYAIIEKYVALNIKYDEQNDKLERTKKNYTFAEAEGDIAFNEKRFDMESKYNASAKKYKNEYAQIMDTLLKLKSKLLETHQEYLNELEKLNKDDINKIIEVMIQKKKNTEKEIFELSLKKAGATALGEEAFENYNVEEEIKYNKISKECYLQIESLNHYVKYYGMFSENLKTYINEKKLVLTK